MNMEKNMEQGNNNEEFFFLLVAACYSKNEEFCFKKNSRDLQQEFISEQKLALSSLCSCLFCLFVCSFHISFDLMKKQSLTKEKVVGDWNIPSYWESGNVAKNVLFTWKVQFHFEDKSTTTIKNRTKKKLN